MTRGRLAWVMAMTFSVVACTSSQEDVGSAESDQTVHPGGNNGRARVTVNLPSFFSPKFQWNGKSYEYHFWFNDTEVTPGVPASVVPRDGNGGCLTATAYAVDNGPDKVRVGTSYECAWQVAAGQSLTIDLGTAKVWWSGYPEARADVFAPDAPVESMVARTWQGNYIPQYKGATGFAFEGTNEFPLVLVPGEYAYVTRNYPAKPFTVTAGQQTDVNVGYDDFLATLKLAYEAGEFPDVPNALPQLLCDDKLWDAHGRWTELPVLVPAAAGPLACQLQLAGATAAVSLSKGQTTTIALGRLDVDDVALREEGGRLVAGTWNVQVKNGNKTGDWLLAKPAATKTGVDLPKGHYQVKVDYRAPTGPATEWFEVDL